MNPAPRLDVHALAHAVLRRQMAECLARLGRVDASDACERAGALDLLDAMLQACRQHAAVARAVLHPAIEARFPGATLQAAEALRDQEAEIEALQAEACATRDAADALTALRLVRHMAAFVGHKLAQMDRDEVAHNAALWQTCDDHELGRLLDALRAATGPAPADLRPTPTIMSHLPGA